MVAVVALGWVGKGGGIGIRQGLAWTLEDKDGGKEHGSLGSTRIEHTENALSVPHAPLPLLHTKP